MDHSQFPRHHGRLAEPDLLAEGENPICGDRVRIYLGLDDKGCINQARFEATGCAISLASVSLLTQALHGLGPGGFDALFGSVQRVLRGQGEGQPKLAGELESLKLIPRFPHRIKCASLCWHAVNAALCGNGGVATTE